jgi:hypothetical protein
MSAMYGKSFESMYEGSLIGAGINVFAVWNYIITKGRKGTVEINPKLLAFTLGGSEADVISALDYLQQPDPNSRSKECEGRRLVKEGQFQYRIVNWAYYDSFKCEAERRHYNRIAQQEFRSKKKGESNPPSAPKSPDPDLVMPFPSEAFRLQWVIWEGCRRSLKKPKSWYVLFSEQLKWLSQFSEDQAIECLSMSIRNGYTGLIEPKTVPGQSVAPSVFNLKTVMEQKQKLADQIRNEHATTDALSTTWDDQANREKYRALRGEIKELSQKLAGAL